jgi:hypothetical protein
VNESPALDPPDPPEGYREPVSFAYPPVKLALGSIALFVLAVVGFGRLTSRVRGETTFEFTVGLAEIGVVAVLFAGTIVVHELIHGLVYRFLGYRVNYGLALNVGAAYAAAFGQFQTRRDNLLVALAPIVVITAALTPLLAVGSLPVAVAAFLVLVVNTSGAIGDLFIAWRLLRMPEGTLMFDVDARHSYVYYPEASD